VLTIAGLGGGNRAGPNGPKPKKTVDALEAQAEGAPPRWEGI
jgi:hypothetical protein